MKEHTPKNFIIQLGSLLTLYVSLVALMVVIFGLINLKFPDALDYYGTAESMRDGMRVGIAMLIVFFPTYIVLTRLSNQNRRKEDNGEYTTLAKWLVYFSLLVGGGVLLGDFVTILIYFLNGEITMRFILKALALFVVVGGALAYYALDARGHFKKNEKQSIQFGIGASVLVLIALIYGMMNIETPAEVREMKLDDQQITDLQEIQWRTEEFYRIENRLPQSLSELYAEGTPPDAPEERANYEFNVVDETTYELCATFAEPSSESLGRNSYAYPMESANFNWEHEAGEKCFKRVIVTDENLKPMQ